MTGAIDTHALLEVVYASIAICLVVSFTYATMLYAAVRAADHRRDGSRCAALAFTGLSLVGAAVNTAIVVYGLVIIIAK